jgi:dTDP-4-amino-4,6-dideoxygalactose transaminase
MRHIGVGTFKVTETMRTYVNDVLDTGRISYGWYSRELEREFANLHDCTFGVLSNSGTSSLQVALQALKELRGWNDGDEVLIPSVTFVATANIVLHCNMKPVLVDVELVHYEMDPHILQMRFEELITKKTRAIIPVHLFGQPCDMVKLSVLAKEHNLAMIEDSCECMFVASYGRMVGSWGDVGCFSTYVAHLLTTGVGGIATTNDPEIAAKMRSLVNHGRDGIYMSVDDDKNLSENKLNEVISRRFNFESIGHSYRITELEAALGLAQLKDYRAMIDKRNINAFTLTTLLKKFEGKLQLPSVRFGNQHAWMMYPIMVQEEHKKPLTEYLEANGIETRDMLPLVNQPCYKGMWNPADYKRAQVVDKCGFYVGIHQELVTDDLDYIADKIGEYYDRQ